VNSSSKRIAMLAVCCSCLTHVPQAAAARIVGQPDIFTAARNGNLSLVKDHVLADETSVNKKGS